jgi:ADP-L-glycero-D-manno-heptose 6-epimerase
MRCLVTGGAGFIGSNLAIELERLGHEVTVTDNFHTGFRGNLKLFKGRVIQVDLSRPFELDETYDAIFHQAAITDPRHPDDAQTLQTNVNGWEYLLNHARRMGAKVVYASTASLYGNGPSPQREDQAKELLSAYARSKLIMDEMASHHWRDRHIVGLRYFNVFGPHEANKGRAASMIYHLARQMVAGQRPRIFQDGEQKRDHIYVKDCVLANLKALDGTPGVYNVGTGVATSFNLLVKYLNDALGTQLEPEYIPNPYGNTYQNDTRADVERAEKYLGFKAQWTTERGIADYVQWMRGEGLL